ncbi:MAG: hypothetical protein H0T79_20920 [Deltaproteobacteria bacterium]|nr:hypothetical protein [Deltaproteobacteria bacterium]
MRKNLECPIVLAADHAERCHNYSDDAATMARVALFARDLYREPDGATPAINLNPVLEDFAAAMERFARELADLGARFDAFDDHDIEHDHVAPGAIATEALTLAMFGPEDDDDDDDDDVT